MSLASTVFGHRARAVGVNAALVVLTGKDSSQEINTHFTGPYDGANSKQ